MGLLRVQRELDDFREDILSKIPQEIYDAAYHIILKSDIAECFSEADYYRKRDDT